MSTIKKIKIGGSEYDIVAVDSNKLDGKQGSYYLDYNNFINTPPTLMVEPQLTTEGVVVWETVAVTDALNAEV